MIFSRKNCGCKSGSSLRADSFLLGPATNTTHCAIRAFLLRDLMNGIKGPRSPASEGLVGTDMLHALSYDDHTTSARRTTAPQRVEMQPPSVCDSTRGSLLSCGLFSHSRQDCNKCPTPHHYQTGNETRERVFIMIHMLPVVVSSVHRIPSQPPKFDIRCSPSDLCGV
jgi:hypothetical protein